MGAVGVHLDDHPVAGLQGPDEARQVGGAEPLLALAVQDVHVVVAGREFVGELAGAVGAVVVRDQDVGLGHRRADPADDQPDVLRLVVGRNDHQGCTERPVGPLSTVAHWVPFFVVLHVLYVWSQGMTVEQ